MAFGYSAEHRKVDGLIRKMWPSETDRFAAHMLRLSRDERRMRFGHLVSDSFIESYAKRALDLNGIVYGYFDNGELRGVAELRPLEQRWTSEAEAAFSVEHDYQDSGVGTELMGRVIRAARNRQVQHLYMNCLAENRKMQKIARKHDASLRFEHGDVVGEVIPAEPTYFTRLEEAFEDSRSYMLAVLDLQARISKAA